ncbi:MAG: hypothetical protein IPG89_07460 [Bacteroidetes bacterium]|nr:hypothetical protein [Bacteroidota bacterium]
MKTLTIIFALLLFVSTNAFSQKTLDKVVNETCDCMNKAPIKDNMNGDEFQEMIGTCLTKPLGDNYEKLCKELKIVNDGSTESLPTTRSKIASKLLSDCPKFMELSMKVEDNKTKQKNIDGTINAEEVGKTGTATGVVKSIDKKDFYLISITNTAGSKESFIWLRYFTGSSSFENNPAAQVGKTSLLRIAK